MEVECSAALRKSLSERRHTLSHESKYVNEVFVNNRIVRMSAFIKKLQWLPHADSSAGGRLGYCLFYQPAWYLTHPLQIFSVWQGGMSAHGGLLGVLIVMALYVRRHGMQFWQLTDFVVPLVPLGLFFGRIGNFINGELWGRPASPGLPWAMIFPQAQDGGIPRHPSQLYEAGLEGLALFVVLWFYSRKPRPVGRTAALFALGYGAARFVSEYFREPDAFLGLQALGLSRGQWLTLPLILAGLTLWVWAGRRRT